MTKWLQLSFAWKHITTFASGKEKIVQTGPLLFLKRQIPKYREPNTNWSVYIWGPAHPLLGCLSVLVLRHSTVWTTWREKVMVIGTRMYSCSTGSAPCSSCTMEKAVKTSPSPIFIITICWKAGVRFGTLWVALACWSSRIPDADVAVWQVSLFSPCQWWREASSQHLSDACPGKGWTLLCTSSFLGYCKVRPRSSKPEKLTCSLVTTYGEILLSLLKAAANCAGKWSKALSLSWTPVSPSAEWGLEFEKNT